MRHEQFLHNKMLKQHRPNFRRPFTLLEIMLALLILVTAAGFLGWKAKDLLDLHNFEEEVAGFYHDLEVAQLCALALHTEIKVNFSKDSGHWEAKFLTDEMILENWSKRPRNLNHVDIAWFKNQLMSQLTINPNGVITPSECLFFSGQDRKYSINCTRPFNIKLHTRGEDGNPEPPI